MFKILEYLPYFHKNQSSCDALQSPLFNLILEPGPTDFPVIYFNILVMLDNFTVIRFCEAQ